MDPHLNPPIQPRPWRRLDFLSPVLAKFLFRINNLACQLVLKRRTKSIKVFTSSPGGFWSSFLPMHWHFQRTQQFALFGCLPLHDKKVWGPGSGESDLCSLSRPFEFKQTIRDKWYCTNHRSATAGMRGTSMYCKAAVRSGSPQKARSGQHASSGGRSLKSI